MTQILIVDDDANNRAVLADALCEEPYELHEADNGRQAVELAQAKLPDLILLDIMMPGMDGISVLRELRAHEETKTIPVIVVSACGSESQVVACLEEGALDHVSKPFSNAVVRARVRAALRTQLHEHGDLELKGKTLGLIGAKGGVGTTTVALNLALILQQRQHKVNALELRPSYGTFAASLGMAPARNIRQLAQTPSEPISSEMLRPILCSHASGLRVLFGPQPDDGHVELPPKLAANLVLTLGRMADYTVIDLPAIPSATTLSALSYCDQFVLVLEPESSSLDAALVMKRQIADSVAPEKFVGMIVVRQTVSSSSLTVSHIESAAACPVIGVILPDADLCYDALSSGTPFVLSDPGNVISLALRDIAQELCPVETTTAAM